jgi:hypothetical protein
MTNFRQTEAGRFSLVYSMWREDEQAEGRSPNLVGFAAALGFDSHSAIADQLNGKRDLTAKTLRGCYEQWHISANWLLYGDGPMHAFESVVPGTTEEQLAQYVAQRLNRERASELAECDTLAVARSDEDPTQSGARVLVDGAALLQAAYDYAAGELSRHLERLDLESVSIEAVKHAQHAAVHGTKLPPMASHPSFERMLRRADAETNAQPTAFRRLVRVR